jgi:hypothetical protein
MYPKKQKFWVPVCPAQREPIVPEDVPEEAEVRKCRLCPSQEVPEVPAHEPVPKKFNKLNQNQSQSQSQKLAIRFYRQQTKSPTEKFQMTKNGSHIHRPALPTA